ncbi:hypothetical protein GGI23_003898, partial [Coemansia sp. RSA 2559]
QVNGTAASRGKPGAKEQLEHDTCDACDQPGQFVCCDLCPRVFHFYCADPPMSREAVSKIDHWFCRECAHRASGKRKSRAHVKNAFYPLISDMEFRNPRVFAVPDEIRRQFDGVERDIDGAFINVREDRPQRVNGGQANRDFTRLVDDHNETIMCYRCGLSALHGLMVRCDYCPLNWHWDCLDPPLCSAPPPHKRWMCPNHADHAMRRHRKFRKERIIDLTDAPETARNNGIIDIIDDDPPPVELFDPKVKYKIPSSRIYNEFAKHAMPCVMALGVDQKSDLESITHMDTQQQQLTSVSSTLANSLADALDTNCSTLPPPVMSVAEWLQSIVAFQQDVARFVMTTAKEAVLQETYKRNRTNATGISVEASKDDKIAMLSTIAAQVLSPLIRVPATNNTDHLEDSGGTERSAGLVSTADNQDVESVEPNPENTTGGINHSAEESDKMAAASALEELPSSMVHTEPTLRITSEVVGKRDGIPDMNINTADHRRKCLLDRHGLSETEAKNAIECIIGHGAGNSDDCNKRKHDDASPSPSPSDPVANAANVSSKRMRQLESGEDTSDAANASPKQEPLPHIHDSATPQQQYANGDTLSLARTTHLSELVASLLRAKGADAILDFLAS